MTAEMKLHESVLKQVQVGQPCIVTVDALPGLELEGRVEFVAMLPDQNSRWSNPSLRVYRCAPFRRDYRFLEVNPAFERLRSAAKGFLVIRHHGGVIFRREEPFERSTDDLSLPIPAHPLGGGINERDDPPDIDAVHDVVDVLHQVAVLLLAFPQRFLDPVSLVDLEGEGRGSLVHPVFQPGGEPFQLVLSRGEPPVHLDGAFVGGEQELHDRPVAGDDLVLHAGELELYARLLTVVHTAREVGPRRTRERRTLVSSRLRTRGRRRRPPCSRGTS
jgi:hypothetical protein